MLDIFTDGACSGNPGPAGIGVIIQENGKPIKTISRSIGSATNNIAEYAALIFGLQEALILQAESVRVSTDSELMFQQIRGRYKIKEPFLRVLFELCQPLIGGFKAFDIRYIPREKNKDADKLATQAIKKEQVKMVAPTVSLCEAKRNKAVGEESPSSKG